MFLRQLLFALARRAQPLDRKPDPEPTPRAGPRPPSEHVNVGGDAAYSGPIASAFPGPPKDRILQLIEGGNDEAALQLFLAQPVAEILATLEEELRALNPEELKVLNDALKGETGKKWVPLPGPQTRCVITKADITLYGGAAGGGKSDLLLGLARTEHKRSLIIRRQYSDLGFLTERLLEINKTRKGFVGGARPTLRVEDRLIEFGACLHLGDEQAWQGQPHDFLGIDEASQLLEAQVRYFMGWVRSTDTEQRTRVVLSSNPPLSDEGQWIVAMFGPWLNPQHPRPAKPGELRWFVSDVEGKDMEVDGRGPHLIGGREVMALSRTYIPARLGDNPYLSRTEYAAKLDAMQEPMRSAMRDGDFLAARSDDVWQVIPSDWIRQAQARWTPEAPKGQPMTCLAIDCAGGGKDAATIATRFGSWFSPIVSERGPQTADGRFIGAKAMMIRQNNCQMVVDVGGGYGGDTVNVMKDNDVPVVGYRGSDAGNGKSVGSGLEFANRRAQDWWRFREALDPAGKEMIALPPDQELAADLSTPRLDARAMQVRGIIQIESKEMIRERLGRSPDKGDAVVMAWPFGGLLEFRRKETPRYPTRANVSPAAAKRYGWAR